MAVPKGLACYFFVATLLHHFSLDGKGMDGTGDSECPPGKGHSDWIFMICRLVKIKKLSRKVKINIYNCYHQKYWENLLLWEGFCDELKLILLVVHPC